MNIEQANQRQYFSRELTGHEVSEGVKAVGKELSNLLDTGLSVAQKANETTIANNQISYANDCLKLNDEINTKWQADPTNPEREKELKQAFENAAQQYKVNPLCESQWREAVNNVNNRFSQYNTQWQISQQKTNAQINLKEGYEKLKEQYGMAALNGASDEQLRLMHANGIEALKNASYAVLGPVFVDDSLSKSTHDFATIIVSSIAQNDPLRAQKMINDPGMRNDIGDPQTIEQLENYITSSLANQHKKEAVNQLCTALRAMNSKEADDLIDGRANIVSLNKFIETHKSLNKGSIEFLNSFYGYSTKETHYYDPKKRKIVEKPEGGSGGGSGDPRLIGLKNVKLGLIDKANIAESLENSLHDMISFSGDFAGFQIPSAKDVNKNKIGKQANSALLGYMGTVANMQGTIDAACSAGAISKDDRKRLMNTYIAPVTDYFEKNLSQLDEKDFAWGMLGKKLGYGKIQEQFNTEGLKGKELQEVQRQKLFAQNYYLKELNKVVDKSPHLKSIYDIEKLPSDQQQAIYKLASENALKQAKRWTDKPEYYFEKEYKNLYEQPFVYLGQKQALQVNRIVAEETYKRAFEDQNGKSTLELEDFAKSKMYIEINKAALNNRRRAGDMLRTKDMEMTISRPDPVFEFQGSTNPNAFHNRLKELGLTWEQFEKIAINRGYVSPNGGRGTTAGFLNCFRALSHAKALDDLNKRNKR